MSGTTLDRQLDAELSKLTPENQALVKAIAMYSRMDEVSLTDQIISDLSQRRGNFFGSLYIDLSAAKDGYEISGAGNLLHAVDATDQLAELSFSVETPEPDSRARYKLKRGDRFFLPFTKIYIYNDAQASKYIQLLRGTALPSMRVGYESDAGDAANNDLLTALGNSAVFSTAQISVGTSATVIKAASATRKRITIKNPVGSGQVLYIGRSNGVTTANGHMLDAGDSITLGTEDAIWGIFPTSANNVSYLEE